jgi:hypothetical protein
VRQNIKEEDILTSNLIDPNQYDEDQSEMYKSTLLYWKENKERFQEIVKY